MGKKKRKQKITILGVPEGVSESIFLKYLIEIYGNKDLLNFTEHPSKGGNPDRILNFAIKNCHYDKSFAWIDEDVDLSQDSREELGKCWNLNEEDKRAILSCPLRDIQARFNQELKKQPVLIVSQPVCVESLILKILGKTPKHLAYDQSNRTQQINDLKNMLAGVFGKFGKEKPLDYYRKNLSKETLEERRKSIPELDLLIKMIS